MTPFEFAADATQARAIMRRYAAMFDRGPVLDLGSGRGFFLEALRNRGIEGRGIDISPAAVEAGRSLGFDVVQADVIEYLDGAAPVAGAFAAHLIEHMESTVAGRLVERLADVVQPGGRIVIVTPDPRDLRNLMCVFWLDPTHVRFYPHQLLGRMLESTGFRVEGSGSSLPPVGPRQLTQALLGKVRFGRHYGNGEVWVRAVRG